MTTTSNQNLPPQPTQVGPNAVDPSDHEHTLVLIDQTRDAKDFSRDIADARIAEELNTGGRFKRLIKGVWKGNIAHEYYRQKYISEAQSTIVAGQDINAHETDVTSRQNAANATINRFTSEYDELVHESAGEQKREVANDGPLASAAKQMIREYALGNLDDTTIIEERNRILNELRQQGSTELIGQGLVMVDNLIKVAQAVKGSVEHGESIDTVMSNMRVVTAEARSGVRTEARYSKTDKAIEKINKIPGVGKWLSPTAVGIAAGVVTTLTRLGSRSVARATAYTGAGAVLAGAYAGMRENKRFKDEKAQHDREMAQGKGFAPEAKKRKKFEKVRYQSVRASDKIAEFNTYLEEGALDSVAARQDAYNKLALLQLRIDRSDTSKADLVTYSSTTSVEQERFDLDVARARLKVELRDQLAGADPAELAALGYDPSQPINTNLALRGESFAAVLDEDRTAKDKAFRNMKAFAVGKAAAVGAASAFGFGLVAQEGVALLDPSRLGLVEEHLSGIPAGSGGGAHNTVLEGMFGNHNAGDAVTTSVHHDASDAFTQHAFGEGNVSVSSDHQLIDHGDGTFSLTDPSGEHTVNGLTVDAHGTLTPDSIKMLEANGMQVDDLSHTTMIDTPPIHQDVQTDVHGFMDAHQGDATHVTRDLWYDNDTPAPNYDQNELGLEFGGGNGTGIAPDGSYTMSTGSMTESGSFHDGLSTNWQEQAQQGHLKLAISATGDTQSQVFMVDVNPDGSINMPKDSLAAQFFHTEQVPVIGEDGAPVIGGDGQTVMQDHLVFDGKYAEVVQTTGVDDAGVEHIRPLATHTGTDTLGDKTFTTSTEIPQPPTAHVTPDYQIKTGGFDTVETTPGETFTEMAPSIPIASRRSIEAIPVPERRSRDSDPSIPPYYGYYGGNYNSMSPEQIRQRREETSPRLLEDPNRNLNPQEELTWYRDLVKRKRGDDYVAGVDADIARSPELSGMSGDIRAIITIPVAAASELESKTIYSVLANAYAQQDPDALSQTLMLLNLNYFDDLQDDEDAMRNFELTKSEVERAKRDFPDLKIAVMVKTYNRTEVKKTGGVIGHVARDLYDTAMLSVQKGMAEGRLGPDSDIILLRNDADPKGMDKHYLRSFIKTVENTPEPDVYTGTLSYDSARAKDLPGFLFATNFMQSINVLAAVREKNVHFAGPNSAMKMSAMAAAGGIGFDPYTGAGSDDVFMAQRIIAARRGHLDDGPASSGSLSGYYTTTNGQPAKVRGTRQIGVRVKGARLESDSDRLEAMYRLGKPIIETWNDGGFDGQEGYTGRSDSLNAIKALGDTGKEDFTKDPDSIIEHVRRDMETTINYTGSDALVRSSLAFAFSGVKNAPSSDAYLLTRGSDGKYKLSFTDLGRQTLLSHFTRNSAGRFDPYANRKARQLFGQVKKGAKRLPTHQAMFRV